MRATCSRASRTVCLVAVLTHMAQRCDFPVLLIDRPDSSTPVPCRPNEPSLTVDTTARNRPGLCPEHPAKLPIRRRPDSWRCRPQRFHRRAPSGKLSRGAGSASWSHSRVRVVRSGIDSGLRALCEPGRLLRPAPPPRIRLRRQLPAPQARRA